MDGADARAGQQSDDQFRRHAHVDGDAVALLDAERLEGVGEALHLGMEFRVGEATDFTGLALPDERDLVAAGAGKVHVETVVAEVGFAAHEPFGVGQIPFEDLVPGLEPVQMLGHRGPEAFGVVNRLAIERLVLGEAVDVRLLGELRRRGKDAVFTKCGIKILRGERASRSCGHG